jgi:PAS domain S-box-containing protein
MNITDQLIDSKTVERKKQRLDNIVEQSKMGVAIFHGSEMTIQFVNQTITQIWGKGKEVLGQKIFDVFPELISQPFPKLLNEVYASGVPQYSYENKVLLNRNGKLEEAFFNFVFQPYFESGTITGVTVLVTEVTESILSKKQVEESERQFRNVLLDSPSIFAIIQGPEMVLTFGNEPLFRSWGKTADIIGKPLLEILPELKNQPFPKLLEQVVKTGKAHYGSEEKATLTRDGQSWERYYNYCYQPIVGEDSTVSGITIMANDITEQVMARKAVEEQNRILARVSAALKIEKDESEKRKRLYEAITGSTPDLIYVFDLDYKFTYANDALLKMWGRSWEDSIGKGLLYLGYEPWHAEMHEREIDQVVATKKSIRGEVSFPHATNGRRVYDYIFVPVFNAHEEVEAVAGTTRDITELKLAEEALKEATSQLEKRVAERTRELQRSNEDLQQFAHVASHDLKEPVRKIKTFGYRLKDELQHSDAKSKTYIEKILVSAERMSTMIEGVLTYSTANASEQKIETLDLNTILSDIQNDLEIDCFDLPIVL